MKLCQHLVNGLGIGAVYAIIALGYTMVYGVANMLNFAHGDVIMVGAYAAYCHMHGLGLPPIAAVLGAMTLCTVLGIAIERVAYRPLRGAPGLSVLITAIGVSYFLQNAAQLIFSSGPKSFPGIAALRPLYLFDGQLIVTGELILTAAVSLAVMVGLTWFTAGTKAGRAMRAVAEDREAALLMGVRADRIIAAAFAIGSALAALAGVLLCWTVPTLQPTTGAMPGIRAFTAAVIGGIGSIPGAMLGGLLIGMIEALSKVYVSSQLSDAVVFGVLIVILLVRPQGLLGRRVREKV